MPLLNVLFSKVPLLCPVCKPLGICLQNRYIFNSVLTSIDVSPKIGYVIVNPRFSRAAFPLQSKDSYMNLILALITRRLDGEKI